MFCDTWLMLLANDIENQEFLFFLGVDSGDNQQEIPRKRGVLESGAGGTPEIRGATGLPEF